MKMRTMLSNLYAQSRGVRSLEGLDAARNLTTLDLGDNPLTNFSLLSGLTSLTTLYLYNNQPEKAASMFRRASDMDPGIAEAYFLLGSAEQADYHYSAADDAYSRAIALAPDNSAYRETYREFRSKMSRDSAAQ